MADAQTLLTEGKCFACFGASTAQIIKLALLARILKANDSAADTSPEALLAYAKCFNCITYASQVALMELALLDQIEHAVEGGGGGGNGNCPENLSGEGDPTGDVTPDFVGQFYTDTVTDNLYKSTGLTDADWELIETGNGECPPGIVEWEPENVDAAEFFGLLSWSWEHGWPGVEHLTVNHTILRNEIIYLQDAGDLLTISFPNLAQMIGGDTELNLWEFPLCADVSLPVLQSVGGKIDFGDLNSLETLALPALESVNVLEVTFNSALAEISIPLLSSHAGAAMRCNNNALTAASVNHILSRVVEFDPAWGAGKTLHLSGGTNAAPTGQGVTDMNTLVAAGVTVNVNE